MMKIKQLFAFVMLFIAASAAGQKLSVESLRIAENDLTARTEQRLDANKQPCALLKVQVRDQITEAQGNVVGTIINKGGEKWIYFTDGTKQTNLLFRNYPPLSIYFPDHGIPSLRANCTYVLTITGEAVYQPGAPQVVNTGKNYLVLTVKPEKAMVTVDGKLQDLADDGSYMLYLPYGSHTYSVMAAGYETHNGTFVISDGEKTILNETLVSVMAQLSVKSTTSDGKIYVNNDLKGTGSWNGTLAAGDYLVEVKKEGCRPYSQSISLSEKERRDLVVPALSVLTGGLNVSYTPAMSEIALDGRSLGTSPGVFMDIPVGSHSLEISKEGYSASRVTVTVREGEVTDVRGALGKNTITTGSASNGNGKEFTVNGVTFKMIPVEGGTFTMGASDDDPDAYDMEKPAHKVTLSDYYIGETEVTQELWQAVMGSNPSKFKGDNLPVENVSWDDCQAFILKLNELTGQTFRLPTEAEWEHAARGGIKSKGYKYAGSNTLKDVAWYDGNSGAKTHPVGSKSSNELGLYDMSGNVYEWCQDWYGSYSSSSQTNPSGASSGSYRVHRGGSWNFVAGRCRVLFRFGDPSSSGSFLGLRLAL